MDANPQPAPPAPVRPTAAPPANTRPFAVSPLAERVDQPPLRRLGSIVPRVADPLAPRDSSTRSDTGDYEDEGPATPVRPSRNPFDA